MRNFFSCNFKFLPHPISDMYRYLAYREIMMMYLGPMQPALSERLRLKSEGNELFSSLYLLPLCFELGTELESAGAYESICECLQASIAANAKLQACD